MNHTFSVARVMSIMTILYSLIHHCMGMEIDAQLTTVPSLRSLTLKRVAQFIGSSELDQTRYLALAGQIRKSYIPDEITADLITALKNEQESFAIPLCFGNMKWYWYRFDRIRLHPSENHLCFCAEHAVVIYNTIKCKLISIYKTKKTISTFDWHPDRPELALITEKKIIVIDAHGKKLFSQSYPAAATNSKKMIRWSADGTRIKVQTGHNRIDFAYPTGDIAYKGSVVCDRCNEPGNYHLFANTTYFSHQNCMHCAAEDILTKCSDEYHRPPPHIRVTEEPYLIRLYDSESDSTYTYSTPDDHPVVSWSYDGRYCTWIDRIEKPRTKRSKKGSSEKHMHLSSPSIYELHVHDCKIHQHRKKLFMPQGVACQLVWSPNDYRVIAFYTDADIHLFDAQTMTELMHHDQKEHNDWTCLVPRIDSPWKNTLMLRTLCQREWVRLLDLTLVSNHVHLSLHDQLMGILAITKRYRTLEKKARTKIAFEKAIIDPVLQRKITYALSRDDSWKAT